ncbi:MAG: OmpA family protein [Candidatus Eisenbacteria bacterium]
MSGFKRLSLLVLLAAFAVSPARAQVAGHPVEVSAGGGWTQYDARIHVTNAPAGIASLAYRWSTGLTFEGTWLHTLNAKSDALYNEAEQNLSWTGVDLRWSLRDPSEKVTPYLITGLGYGRTHTPDQQFITQKGSPSAGAGVIMSLGGRERMALRLQVKDVMLRERDDKEFSNHIIATAALQFTFRGKSKDADLDGVRNWIDLEPKTPIGAKVDAQGRAKDSDGDGVFDGLDKCEGTPKGAKIDKNGCPTDVDGDGVFDGIDTCPDTPKGAKVDGVGCPLDTDGDGVFDGLDQCEGSPKGVVVDAKGCPVDTDGDGVPDGPDQCPATPAGLKVDTNGCPIEVSEKETQLLDTGMIRLQNINFDTGKATLKPESFPVLDEVATILLQYPMLNLEIGGHTDNTGTKVKNVALSETRAKAVLGYLTQKFPTLDATHFTTVGYGPEVPVAPNTSVLGRAKNRRVEFKVTNAEVLKIEREKRHFLKKDESSVTPDKQ